MANDNIISSFISRYVGVKITDKFFGKKQSDLEVRKNDLITDIYNELCQMHLTLKSAEKVPVLLEKQSRIEEIESKVERENNNSFFKQIKDTYISFRSTKILLNETREELSSFREENTELLCELNERFEQFFDRQELLNNQISSSIKPVSVVSSGSITPKKLDKDDGSNGIGGLLSNVLGSLLGGLLGGAGLKSLLGGIGGGLLRGAGGLTLRTLPMMLNPVVGVAAATAFTGKQLYNLYEEYTKEGGHRDLLETHAKRKDNLTSEERKRYEEDVENRDRGWGWFKHVLGFGVNDDAYADIASSDKTHENYLKKSFERRFEEYNKISIDNGFKGLNRKEFRKEFYRGNDFKRELYNSSLEQRKQEGIRLRENTRILQNGIMKDSALDNIENQRQVVFIDNKTINNNNTSNETKSSSPSPKVLSTRNGNNSYNRRVDYDKRFVFAS